MSRKIVRWVASGFGSGYFPVASGTAGTLAAIPLAWLLSLTPPPLGAFLTAFSVIVSIPVCHVAAGKEKDPGWIVLDEIAGFFVAVLWIPPTPIAWIGAFFLFRLFDILKPFPASWFDRSGTGGFGIVMDDVAAGVYARLCLYAATGS